MNTPDTIQLYVHVPFCERKCHYCDFASWESPAVTQRKWLDTVLREIDQAGRSWGGSKAGTVFFGGGTPSVVPVSYLEAILKKLGEHFDLSQVKEMTLEANPSSLTSDKLRGWKALGFGRVSLGVQSFHADELELLGRVHSVESARTALEALSSDSGFRFSADLIFGLPGQSPERFIASLKSLLEYKPEHVSFYGLTVEEGTEFARRQALGTLKLPDGEMYRSLYTQGVSLLAEHGLERYEVSNFAKNGQECLHNQGYWNGIPYLAFGPGAHGFDGTRRWMNPHELEDYLRWGEKGFPDSERVWDELDDEARLAEAVSLGLRQRGGFSLGDVEQRFGTHWPDPVISRWEKAGYLERAQGRLGIRGEGWLVLDEICADLLAKVKRVPAMQALSKSK